MHVMREMVLHNLGENHQSVMYSKRHQTSDLLKELNTRKLRKWALKKQKKIPNIYFYFISYCYVSSPPGSAIDSSVMILVMIRRSGTRYEYTSFCSETEASRYIHTLYPIFWSSPISSPTNGRQKMHFRRYRPNF